MAAPGSDLAYLQCVDDGYGRDGRLDGAHTLVKRVLSLVRADDGPRSTVVDHLLARVLRTWRRLRRREGGPNK